MVTVSVQTPLSAVLEDARTALGRRVSYLCFPGLSPGADANVSSNRRALCHDLDLPIVGHRRQSVTLSVGREGRDGRRFRSEEHTSELQSRSDLVCRLLLEKKKSNRLYPPVRSLSYARLNTVARLCRQQSGLIAI